MKLTKKSFKKLPYQLLLLLLTTGATLILGFLSFGGMFALWPVLPLAFAAFGLSVAYEGEIYLQNIQGSLKKLFQDHYLERQTAKAYLLEQYPNLHSKDCPNYSPRHPERSEGSPDNSIEPNAGDPSSQAPRDDGRAVTDCPQFFKDYDAQLRRLHAFGDQRLDKVGRRQKKQVKKTLSTMEKWFAVQLFAKAENSGNATPYAEALRQWLTQHDQALWCLKHKRRQSYFFKAKLFSALAGFFMSLGTTYLLMEAFAVLPFMAAVSFGVWPIMILPMAAVAGLAYGLLTYNAVTDLIANSTLQTWYRSIRDDLKKGLTIRNVLMASMATLLVALGVALTICTAGTWWTIVKEAHPVFNWMRQLPGFIMGMMNPVITGLSAVIFNLENTGETLALLDDTLRAKNSLFTRVKQAIVDGFQQLKQRENLVQQFNPFRLLLKLTFTPLRILLFLGHLLSIAVTADRMPGMPQMVSALLALISEGFEDAHYFLGHTHSHDATHSPDNQALRETRLSGTHNHSHHNDLPTRVLKLIFSPLYVLATLWDYTTSQMNQQADARLTFKHAWDKQTGRPPKHSVDLPPNTPSPSSDWTIQQILYRIERHQEKQLNTAWVNQTLAQQKCSELNALKNTVSQPQQSPQTISNALKDASTQAIYARHRLFFSTGSTNTTTFLETLADQITPRC